MNISTGLSAKTFFSRFPLGPIKPKQIERHFVRAFNKHLEKFPPGVGPKDIVEDAIRNKWIVKDADGNYSLGKKLLA